MWHVEIGHRETKRVDSEERRRNSAHQSMVPKRTYYMQDVEIQTERGRSGAKK
jgi:hypothetical protein